MSTQRDSPDCHTLGPAPLSSSTRRSNKLQINQKRLQRKLLQVLQVYDFIVNWKDFKHLQENSVCNTFLFSSFHPSLLSPYLPFLRPLPQTSAQSVLIRTSTQYYIYMQSSRSNLYWCQCFMANIMLSSSFYKIWVITKVQTQNELHRSINRKQTNSRKL